MNLVLFRTYSSAWNTFPPCKASHSSLLNLGFVMRDVDRWRRSICTNLKIVRRLSVECTPVGRLLHSRFLRTGTTLDVPGHLGVQFRLSVGVDISGHRLHTQTCSLQALGGDGSTLLKRVADFHRPSLTSTRIFNSCLPLDDWLAVRRLYSHYGSRELRANAIPSGVSDLFLANHLPGRTRFNVLPVANFAQNITRSRYRNSYDDFSDKGAHGNLIKFRGPDTTVCQGGGARPRRPRVWNTKPRRGSIARSEKLIDLVHKLSNVKDEVYGALDAWIAWDLDFPLIAVKKCLKTLQDQREWRRIIQISKWMLDKGQGKTLATYLLLLEALDNEGRVEEAELLWGKVFAENTECVPRVMFGRMISMYERHGIPRQLIQVFIDMEELGVRPDPQTISRVARTYEEHGYPEMAAALLKKYEPASVIYRFINGKRVKIRLNKNVPAKEGDTEHGGSELGDGECEDGSDNLAVQKEGLANEKEFGTEANPKHFDQSTKNGAPRDGSQAKKWFNKPKQLKSRKGSSP